MSEKNKKRDTKNPEVVNEPKKKNRDLLEELNLQWLRELEAEFRGGSDRAVAILSASILDELLQELFQMYFLSDRKRVNALFGGGTQPLATFSAKIELAYCLGLVSQDEYRLLTAIKKIRNDFAHKIHDVSFDTSPIRERCMNLSLPAAIVYNTASTRHRFRQTIIYLGFNLIVRASQAEKRRCQAPEDISTLLVQYTHIFQQRAVSGESSDQLDVIPADIQSAELLSE